MKKLFTLLTALTLFFILASGALAAEFDFQFEDYDVWLETWKEENPQLVNEILRDSLPLWQEYGYDSLDELLEDFAITREEYNDMVLYEGAWEYYDAAQDAAYEEYRHAWVKESRVELGGEPEGLAVMLNDRYIKFADAKPELTDGRTMIPLRVLAESLGAAVDWLPEGKRVTVTLNGAVIDFAVGESSVNVTRDGKTQVIAMDCASYLSKDSTYVPVRFFSEALGLDVLWDKEFNTAVILDRPSIIEWADSSFSKLNKLLTLAATDPDETYRSVTDIAAAVTRFSTLDGNSTYSANGHITMVSRGMSGQISAALDIRDLVKFISDELDASPEELTELTAALSDVSFDMIINADEGVTYVRFPALMEAVGLNADSWLRLEGSYLEESDYTAVSGETMGETLYLNALEMANSDSPVFAVQYLDGIVYSAAKLIGDEAFVTSGGVSPLRITRDSYETIVRGAPPESEEGYEFKELDVTLSVTDYGSASGSFRFRPNDAYAFMGDTRYSGSFSMSASGMTVNMEVHTDNAYLAKITVSTTRSATTEALPTAPPEGSVILTEDDLPYGLASATDLIPLAAA